MITRHYLRSRNTCKVTFELAGVTPGSQVFLVGDFNHWNRAATPMRRAGGCYTVTIELECGHSYHFRYLVDGADWVNDSGADRYSVNAYCLLNCVIIV